MVLQLSSEGQVAVRKGFLFSLHLGDVLESGSTLHFPAPYCFQARGPGIAG